MVKPSLQDIKTLYETFPFPSGATPHLVDHWTSLLKKCLYDSGNEQDIKTFLDAGCGTGENVINFAKTFPHIQFKAVDLSATSIGIAKDRAKEEGVTNISFESADLSNLSLVEEFDCISSLGVVHHTPSPERTLKNLVTALKAGGLLCVDVYGYYGYLNAERGQAAINILEPNFKKLDKRLNAMEWVASSFFGLKPPKEKQDPMYIALVDGFVTPVAFSYKILDALKLVRESGVKNVSWWDSPKLLDDSIEYTSCRGQTLNIPISPPWHKRLKELSQEEKYQFFELCFAPFDYFMLGHK
jgi:SAM-dependent methyltransferase